MEPELLDLGVEASEAVASLRDLRMVNRWLGGRASLRRAVLPLLSAGSRVLDVGCGSADLLADLGSAAAHPLVPVGLDIKPLHLKQAPGGIHRVVGDARALPHPERSFDVVAASLFLHHFDSEQVAGVLVELARCADRAVVINDLEAGMAPVRFRPRRLPVALSITSECRGRPGVDPSRLHPAGARSGVPGGRTPARLRRRALSLSAGSDRDAPTLE